MAAGRPWTRDELLVALGLYLRLPFGQLHQRQPDIVRVADLLGRTPSALSMKLSNLAGIDDSIERRGLPNASQADRDIWAEMVSDRVRIFSEIAAATDALESDGDTTQPTVETDAVSQRTGEDVPAEVMVRRGQELFRSAVLSAYHERCCVTGLNAPPLLVASHIVPWREDPHRRLDPRNGLCLNALHDRAFDRGLITFDEQLKLTLSPKLSNLDEWGRQYFEQFAGKPLSLPDKFRPDPAALARHRERVFIG